MKETDSQIPEQVNRLPPYGGNCRPPDFRYLGNIIELLLYSVIFPRKEGWEECDHYQTKIIHIDKQKISLYTYINL